MLLKYLIIYLQFTILLTILQINFTVNYLVLIYQVI